MFENAGGHFVFNMSDKWSGLHLETSVISHHTFQDLIESGKASANGPGAYQVPVNDDTRVVADLGNVIFFSQMVHPGKKIITKLTDDLETLFLGIMSFMTFLLAMVLAIVPDEPPPPSRTR